MGGSVFFFGGGVKLSKIQFQGIYESNSHSFQSVLVFKNLVVHTLVLTKNGITHLQKKTFLVLGMGPYLGAHTKISTFPIKANL